MEALIVVVDDNAQNRALAQAALEDEGFRVLSAGDGTEAVALVAREEPDCVLLDVNMPGMDGFATCAAIRELPAGDDLPIVFLTAQRDLATFEQATLAGGDDFLTKPVAPGELVMRVRAALKLRRMGQELREHYDMVRRQRDDLMRLNLQKERLSAFVVHDLKNPINAMDLHAQLLLRTPDLPERAVTSAQKIRAEARALLRMVLNLLDISRSEEGDLVLSKAPVALSGLVDEVLADFQVKADQAGVTLASEGGPLEVDADLDVLTRVLANLLDNAIRHAPKGSAVTIATGEHEGRVHIDVSDRGPGIPSALQERVFERFVQAGTDAAITRAGRGLGLTFCKLAVEAHGGSIRIDDREPGTTFRVELPT